VTLELVLTVTAVTADQTHDVLRDCFREMGLSPLAAAAWAGMVGELARQQARHELAQLIARLRATVFGEALFRELAGDDLQETAQAAACRLHVAPRVLRRTRCQIRRLLEQPCPPPCDDGPA